jgi:hypothetical protein
MADDRFSVQVIDGVRVLEGGPDFRLPLGADGAASLIEACFSYETHCVLLHAENLAPEFFDLSSGEAGTLLQKLANYQMRLAIVRPPNTVRYSRNFRAMLMEELPRGRMAVFSTVAAAHRWLREPRAL